MCAMGRSSSAYNYSILGEGSIRFDKNTHPQRFFRWRVGAGALKVWNLNDAS